jgi:hypothetical protein
MSRCGYLAIVIFSVLNSSLTSIRLPVLHMKVSQFMGKKSIYMQGMSLVPLHNQGKSGQVSKLRHVDMLVIVTYPQGKLPILSIKKQHKFKIFKKKHQLNWLDSRCSGNSVFDPLSS